MLKGISAGLAAGALWGMVFVAPRITPGLSAIDLTAGRFVSFGAVSALALLVTARSRPSPSRRQALAALVLSVLGFTGYYLLLVLAIQDAGTEMPTLIIGTIPVWMMLLGKPPGLGWKSILPGVLLTGAGLVLMVLSNAGFGAAPSRSALAAEAFVSTYWRGIGYAVAAMASWTVFGLMNAAWLKRHPQVNAMDWANWLGVATGLGAFLLWVRLGTPSKQLLALANIEYVAIVCIVTGIGSAWVATILWNIASQRLSASLCGQLIVSETIFALLYSYGWDGAWPAWTQLAACVLFIAGILATIRAHR
jgi:drug/metabolite transporter (DMT)-like permease